MTLKPYMNNFESFVFVRETTQVIEATCVVLNFRILPDFFCLFCADTCIATTFAAPDHKSLVFVEILIRSWGRRSWNCPTSGDKENAHKPVIFDPKSPALVGIASLPHGFQHFQRTFVSRLGGMGERCLAGCLFNWLLLARPDVLHYYHNGAISLCNDNNKHDK